MHIIQLQCPNCDGVILANFGNLTFDSYRDGNRFEVTCPHCSDNISIGYISEFKKIEEEVEVTSSQPSAESSGGGGYGLGNPPSFSSDQRSNAMNPNNPAFKAAGANRSNQLNPNNPAFRSSRGRR